MRVITVALFAFALSAGCKKTSPPAGETMGSNHAGSAGSAMANGSGMMASGSGSGSGSAGMTGSAGSGSATAPVVPTSTDFEEQASKDVTDANLEAHLAAMEKQLAN